MGRQLPGWVWLPIVGAVGWAVFASLDDVDDTVDPSARACAEFADAADAYNDGILTVAEFRQRRRTVVDRADGTSVEDEARQLLAVVTQPDGDAGDAVRDLAAACQ